MRGYLESTPVLVAIFGLCALFAAANLGVWVGRSAPAATPTPRVVVVEVIPGRTALLDAPRPSLEPGPPPGPTVAPTAVATPTATVVGARASTAAGTPLRTPTPAAPAAGTPAPTSVRPAPQRLIIERIGVDAPVVNVGLEADGSMGIPQRASDVAWYAPGPVPGEASNALLAGHYDWYGVRGAFHRLVDLSQGDRVTVRRSDGQTLVFVVNEIRWFGARDSPEAVFAPTSRPTITLVTCGGVLDRATGEYDRRLVVRAVLVT